MTRERWRKRGSWRQRNRFNILVLFFLCCVSLWSLSVFPISFILKKNLILVFIFLFLIIIRLALGVQVVFIVHLQRENHSLTKANTHTHRTRLNGQDTQQEAQTPHPSCHRLPAQLKWFYWECWDQYEKGTNTSSLTTGQSFLSFQLVWVCLLCFAA